jgi:negative regulator of sigma-B (phosphoserine phosphatase)
MDTLTGEQRFNADSVIEWGVAFSPISGENVSGDAHLVLQRASGTLVAVVDGLGHGAEAAQASDAAKLALAANADLPLSVLFEICESALRKTRGAALTIASFDRAAPTLLWAGVGNVDGTLLRAASGRRESLLLRNGVVGLRSQPPRQRTLPLEPGDTLFLTTDGIQSSYLEGIETDGSVHALAQSILANYRKATDDALVLVARYVIHGTDGKCT